jgi:FMN phosphatase YigB (HAD superfamily)
MTDLAAVVFDWRGTLVTTLSPHDWVRAALRRLGRDERPDAVWDSIAVATGEPNRLDAPGIDADRDIHRDAYYAVFADAGLDGELADALYAVESDPRCNPFAVDAVPVLRAIAHHAIRIGVLSDIHFDLRPAFADAGLGDVVDAFVLSFEYGMQKPDEGMFRAALAALGTPPERTLMVGDRPGPDGGAVALGMPTLLLPPLTSVHHQRLGLVARLLDVPVPPPEDRTTRPRS